ncbi:heavy metal translocating P-type ATPase [Candidatus Albibeggiatoa sp. nov. NOAA]|uniref:heavy metal translocating P-type ATPase n=1 Tax=Candidatus Albibeggiatoa sp. nov. NOAA TaxID=3162724 RepID=UPI0032F2D965|nr:heavy metal translocating P-type ATPase [Thiotrichaceae bacterium]
MLLALELMAGTYLGLRVLDFYRRRKKKTHTPKTDISSESTSEASTSNHYIKTSSLALFTSSLFTVTSTASPILRATNIILLTYTSSPILKQAEQSIIQDKKIKNDLLNGLVIIGSVATGAYFTAALIMLIYHAGSKALTKTQHRSEKMLTDIFQNQPTTAWIIQGDTEIEVAYQDIQVNDIVVVNTGEVIPIDGVIIQGEAMVDQHTLTGESMPAAKKTGEQVFATTLVLSGRIYIKVEKSGNDTVAAKISHTLDNMLDFKTDVQLVGEKWADKVAVPLLALGAAAFPFIGLSPTLAILYASPGNIFRFCGSLLTLNHLIVASRNGILVKEGAALEKLTHIDTVIFDKTGTLTESQPEVGEIIIYHPSYTEKQVLNYALIAEYKMTHPIAQAIQNKAEEWDLPMPEVDYSEYKMGYGIKASFDNQSIWVGSISFLKMERVAIPENLEQNLIETYQGHSMVMVAVDGELIGAMEIHFKVRPEVTNLIDGLRKRGIKHISILSGDNAAPTRHLAEAIHADSYFHNILPEDKARIVQKFQKQGKTVCFVGDGVNDAIAMKQADVSVSLRGASSVATDMAQVILLDGTLNKLDELFDLSKNLDKNLRHSIIFGASAASGYVIIFPLYLHIGLLTTLLSSLVILAGMVTHAMLPLKQLNQDENLKQITDATNN